MPPETSTTRRKQFLKPMDRMLEVLCGLIMVLTFTCSFSVATANHTEVRHLLIAALGCNVAWGVIDAAFYLMGNFAARGRGILALRTVLTASNAGEAQGGCAAQVAGTLHLLLPASSGSQCRTWYRDRAAHSDGDADIQIPHPPRYGPSGSSTPGWDGA